MKRAILNLLLLTPTFLIFACKSVEEDVRGSSIGSVVTGETTNVEGFFGLMRRANIEAQEQEERERNQETVRAFNLKTGRYEFVPMDSIQHWNEEERRWEFHPVAK